ncbi:SRPBCC family protein [Paenibacillus chondroitinus]|uniref:SRPBCC family protein n=1 Tax=Paenibacillus chondroitinus TaxID=59842 RepID=A0ABU6DFI9_9BACL|nr:MULTISPECIES: SRPBCC family protein [Paenibacillus]MCY9658876.1 SRPBCC family protein [Paenibacillus anseongense]MEB4795738.1 SRPBCC family protein [Paenibacillus chondroitinus]
MLASIHKKENGYIAQFDRPLGHAISEVWAVLTDNERLEKWMANLQADDLRKGGHMKFDMKDGSGTLIDMEITDYEPLSVLEFMWGKDRVRFEVSARSEGSLLVLKEFIGTMTDHTPKDLAGWHVCLDMLSALLDGQVMEFPMDEWKKWYEQYGELVKQVG